MYVASFDIGKCNFACYVEKFEEEELLALKNIPKIQRYNATDGSSTEQFAELMQNVYTNGSTVFYKNMDLTVGTNKSKYLDKKIYVNMINALDEHKEVFDKCSIIVIEQQMSFKAAQNTMALKLGQHCYSYFLFRYGETKEIIEFPAYYKTQILGAPKVSSNNGKLKAMSKPDRKKWAVEKAGDILLNRGDLVTLEEFSSKRKRDDLADVLIQLQSFKYLRYVDKSL
jgi:hypothetical protein